MKLVLTTEEVKALLIAKINKEFKTDFNDVTFNGYSQFHEATFVFVKPDSIDAADEAQS